MASAVAARCSWFANSPPAQVPTQTLSTSFPEIPASASRSPARFGQKLIDVLQILDLTGSLFFWTKLPNFVLQAPTMLTLDMAISFSHQR